MIKDINTAKWSCRQCPIHDVFCCATQAFSVSPCLPSAPASRRGSALDVCKRRDAR